MSEAQKKVNRDVYGSKNPNWKGGTTPLGLAIRSSKKYEEWRGAVFQRDTYICMSCGDSRGGNLEADHKVPFSSILRRLIEKYGEDVTLLQALRFEEFWDVDNGRTLCVPCHKKTETWGIGALRV